MTTRKNKSTRTYTTPGCCPWFYYALYTTGTRPAGDTEELKEIVRALRGRDIRKNELNQRPMHAF